MYTFNFQDQIESKPKLVYSALGTIFNLDDTVYRKIIETFSTKLEADKYELILSVGAACHAIFTAEIEAGTLKVPANILLLPSAPQISILQRASLFISHCGMNSTSESVHYGVPIIALPQGEPTDQPIVAKLVDEKLKIGVQLDSKTFTSDELAAAVRKVTGDASYLERILELSAKSRKFIGGVNGANRIIEIIQEGRTKN